MKRPLNGRNKAKLTSLNFIFLGCPLALLELFIFVVVCSVVCGVYVRVLWCLCQGVVLCRLPDPGDDTHTPVVPIWNVPGSPGWVFNDLRSGWNLGEICLIIRQAVNTMVARDDSMGKDRKCRGKLLSSWLSITSTLLNKSKVAWMVVGRKIRGHK